jgi:hypothetical protein
VVNHQLRFLLAFISFSFSRAERMLGAAKAELLKEHAARQASASGNCADEIEGTSST